MNIEKQLWQCKHYSLLYTYIAAIDCNLYCNSQVADNSVAQGLSRLCVHRVIWTPITLFFDSLDTQKFMLEFADDDFS